MATEAQSGAREGPDIPHETSFAEEYREPGETWDNPCFDRDRLEEDGGALMLEIPVGTKNYYQCYVVEESLNELKVRIPANRKLKTPERTQWLNKCSSRISRTSMNMKLWGFIKGSHGAWYLKGSENEVVGGIDQRKKPKSTSRKEQSEQGNTKKKRKVDGNMSKIPSQSTTATEGTISQASFPNSNFDTKAKQTPSYDSGNIHPKKKIAVPSKLDSSHGQKECRREKITLNASQKDISIDSKGAKALSIWFRKHFETIRKPIKLENSAESGDLEFLRQKIRNPSSKGFPVPPVTNTEKKANRFSPSKDDKAKKPKLSMKTTNSVLDPVGSKYKISRGDSNTDMEKAVTNSKSNSVRNENDKAARFMGHNEHSSDPKTIATEKTIATQRFAPLEDADLFGSAGNIAHSPYGANPLEIAPSARKTPRNESLGLPSTTK